MEFVEDNDSDKEDCDPDSQVTHLILDGEYDNFEHGYPVGPLTEPLPSLHTLQLYSLALQSGNHLDYNFQNVQRISIWNCHVSIPGLFLVIRSSITITHFAIGGTKAQVIQNSNDAASDPVIPPPSFPSTLAFLHIDICALVNSNSSHVNNPQRPHMLTWLSNLHGRMSLSILQCKFFTTDIHVPKKLASLAERTLERLTLFAIETYVGSCYLFLGYLTHLETLEVQCNESRIPDVVAMLRSILTPSFRQLSIIIPLTSLNMSFSSLNTLNIAAHDGFLHCNRRVDIYLVCEDTSKHEEMKQAYSGIIIARLFHVIETGRLGIHWFSDAGMTNRFNECPDWRCITT
ncbi:hypothetical protein IW261DRAFT_1478936 [Armillaria novae-zelandiae]|uniref:Uncharacterized protein n=1 Tax=Armillaria novae-zelandiae TaxID=153914 RepID=A0AA39P8V4_9AGAR|nr:hypothetical protein IW261DRAFT_1478936 [Armillaria novae-zelandiae]